MNPEEITERALMNPGGLPCPGIQIHDKNVSSSSPPKRIERIKIKRTNKNGKCACNSMLGRLWIIHCLKEK